MTLSELSEAWHVTHRPVQVRSPSEIGPQQSHLPQSLHSDGLHRPRHLSYESKEQPASVVSCEIEAHGEKKVGERETAMK